MGYRCYVTGEHVNGKKPIMVAISQRKVSYINYAVSMKGKNLFKQYIGTTEGYETVKEVAVSPDNYESFISTLKPTIQSTREVINEHEIHKIKYESKSMAIANNKVIVNNDLPKQEKEPVNVFDAFDWAQDE